LQAVSASELASQFSAYAVGCTRDDDVGHLKTHPQLIGQQHSELWLQVQTEHPSHKAEGKKPNQHDG
jgi:hypothetical protein